MICIYSLDAFIGIGGVNELEKGNFTEIRDYYDRIILSFEIRDIYEVSRNFCKVIIVTPLDIGSTEEFLKVRGFQIENIEILSCDRITEKRNLRGILDGIENEEFVLFFTGNEDYLRTIDEGQDNICRIGCNFPEDDHFPFFTGVDEDLSDFNVKKFLHTMKECYYNWMQRQIVKVELKDERIWGYSLFFYIPQKDFERDNQEDDRPYECRNLTYVDTDGNIIYANGNNVVYQFKKNNRYIGQIFAYYFKQIYKTLYDIPPKTKVILCAVPPSKKSGNERYHWIAEKVAEAGNYRYEFYYDMLYLEHDMEKKHEVSSTKRKNLSEEFKNNLKFNEEYKEIIKDKVIIIFDDVITKGENIKVCYNKLREYTDGEIYFLTLACTKLRGESKKVSQTLVEKLPSRGRYVKNSLIKRSLYMYTKEEMVILSMIYSEYTDEQYPKEKVDHELLFETFRLSLRLGKSIFDKICRIGLIEESVTVLQEKNSRKDYTKRCEQLIRYFDNFDYDGYFERAQQEISLAENNNIKIITYLDTKYPTHLKAIGIPPFVLYIKGLFPTLNELKRSLAIIGSRQMDEKYGKTLATKLGEHLLNSAWYNISGLALGCDEYGHRGSLGATGAILGQGLCTPIFPPENIELAQDILDNDGFLMSELPPSIKPKPYYLVQRDRLQSGVTRGVIVVETSINGGTLHTVKFALEQGKTVFVMDMDHVKALKNEAVVQGNIALLDPSKTMGPIKISKKEREKIIGLKKIKELDNYLEEIGNKPFPKPVDGTVAKDESEKTIIQQTLL